MIANAEKDSKQYQSYKNILGKDKGSLANFRQMKYNDSEKFIILKKKVDTYTYIDKKGWTDDFKQKSKDAYVRFLEKDIYMSVHALSRLPRLNKSNLPEISENDLMAFIKDGTPKYIEGENKLIYFDAGLQLVVVRNKETSEVVSAVRRKYPGEVWIDV